MTHYPLSEKELFCLLSMINSEFTFTWIVSSDTHRAFLCSKAACLTLSCRDPSRTLNSCHSCLCVVSSAGTSRIVRALFRLIFLSNPQQIISIRKSTDRSNVELSPYCDYPCIRRMIKGSLIIIATAHGIIVVAY